MKKIIITESQLENVIIEMAYPASFNMDEFKNILLKVNTNGSQVRLRDVARIELGAESYNSVSRYNGKPASGIAINLATGANALQTATLVKAKMAELSKYFAPGIKVVYPYDTTTFIKISITEKSLVPLFKTIANTKLTLAMRLKLVNSYKYDRALYL